MGRSKKHRNDAAEPAVSPIPLAQPVRSPAAKTLVELAQERQLFDKAAQRAAGGHADGADGDAVLGPFANAVFTAITLTILHFTLDVLVHHQYAQTLAWSSIWRRTALGFPGEQTRDLLSMLTGTVVLGLVTGIYVFGRRNSVLSQLFFFAVSVAAGCYLIHASNVEGYFAVMKRAPPLGTLWVWGVAESKLPYAASSLLIALAFLYLGGYSFL